jgi:uncharacterized protein (TIGR03437 family)
MEELMNTFRNLCCLALVTLGTALAQPSITGVLNAGSRVASGFPGYGIAQGSIFAVTGANVGTDPLQQAAFPLPTTDGLGGVTVQASVGGTNVDCILVYVSAGEVGAILPSGTPTGDGTLTINNNGQSTTANITVVPAAFGIFTQSQTGQGAAEAFNVGGDGSTSLNTLTAPAAAGQAVMLNGTGLGAITSDETQSGVTDTPGASPKVFVGLKEATVVSAARGACCSGVDATFKVPQGVAGWDVIQFVVPDGVTGCHVPVVVQTGDRVSNFTTIAVSNAGACSDPGGFSGSTLQNLTGSSARIGSISLSRTSAKISAAGQTITSNTDAGAANFTQYDLTQLQASPNAISNITALGSCYVITSKVTRGDIPSFMLPTGLNAGNAINVKGPNGTKQMMPTQNVPGSYSGTFGTTTTLPSIPGLPGGLPGLPGQTPPFLEAGNYTVDNGAGGSDIGPFTATLALKTPLTWVNQDAITQVTRSQGVNVTWSGGDPAGIVTISGGVTNTSGNDTYIGTFVCTAPVSAGQFTVPSIVTLSLPPSSATSIPGAGSTPTGSLSVGTTISGPFTAPNIDIGIISSTVFSFKNVGYI